VSLFLWCTLWLRTHSCTEVCKHKILYCMLRLGSLLMAIFSDMCPFCSNENLDVYLWTDIFESLDFWTLSIDLNSKLLENQNVSIAGSVSVFRWGAGDTYQWLRLAVSKEPNIVGVSLTSTEVRNWPSSRNFVFSSYLEFWTTDKIHKSSACVKHHRRNPLEPTAAN
jgi:hypothetical protein